MKIEKKFGKWYKDTRFVDFSNQIHQKATKSLENGSHTTYFEELYEPHEYNHRYIDPMVEYLICHLHIAQLCKNKQQRERADSGFGIKWHRGLLYTNVLRMLQPTAHRTRDYSGTHIAREIFICELPKK